MNSFQKEFQLTASERYNIDRATMTLGDWICTNTKLQKRNFSFERYPFQEQICNDMHPNMDVIKPSQVGLALDLETPILTPQGWKTMGSLEVGDQVFDERGFPCNVTFKSEVHHNHDCYRVVFDDNQEIIADAEHRWFVHCDKAFNSEGLYPTSGRIPLTSNYAREGIVSTQMLAENYHQKGRNIFRIPTTVSLKTPKVELPIDPYFLGCWLGDGNSAHSTLTGTVEDMAEVVATLESRGLTCKLTTERDGTVQYSVQVPNAKRGVDTMHKRLNDLGVLNNKHIPWSYLMADFQSRRELLQGLLDTDGSITAKGRVSFYNTNAKLIEAVEQLCASLGFKFRTRWREPSGGMLKSGHEIKPSKKIAEVSFMTYNNYPVFKLERKRKRLKPLNAGRVTETYGRRIVRVDPVPTRPTQCITVDSPNHLYLAGKGLVPTHNTEIQIRKALALLMRHDGISLIFTLPNEKMYKRISKARIKPLVQNDRAFHSPGASKDQSMDLMKIGSSFLYVTGSSEADATSIDADIIMNDEIDLSDQEMIALFNSRLQGSDMRVNQRFSTPTYEGFGVHKGFVSSDQHQYLARCQCCGHWQQPEFNRDFIRIPGLPDYVEDLQDLEEKLLDDGVIQLDGACVLCEKCYKPLDLSNHDKREWVAKYPSRTHARGYEVSPFSTERLDVPYILGQLFKYKRRGNLKGFNNTVLGKPHNDLDARLSEHMIEACFTGCTRPPEYDPSLPHFMGVDVGQTCYITIARGHDPKKLEWVLFETCPAESLAERTTRLCEIYHIEAGTSDRHPYTPTSNEVRDATKGLIVPAEYRGTKEINEVQDAIGNLSHIQIDRTTMIDYVANGVRGRGYTFNGYGDDKGIISSHLRDMVRDVPDEGAARWVKLTGEDHYFHSMAFLIAGMIHKGVLTYNKDYQRVGSIGLSQPTPAQDDLSMGTGDNLIGFSNGYERTKNGVIVTRHKY